MNRVAIGDYSVLDLDDPSGRSDVVVRENPLERTVRWAKEHPTTAAAIGLAVSGAVVYALTRRKR